MFDYKVLAERCGLPYEIHHGEWRGVFTGNAEPCGDGKEVPLYRFPGGETCGDKTVAAGTCAREFKRMLDEDNDEQRRELERAARANGNSHRMGWDEFVERFANGLKHCTFRPVPFPEERKECRAWYYYAEERLYILKFMDGTIAFSLGGSPYDAWKNWNLAAQPGLTKWGTPMGCIPFDDDKESK